MATRYQLLGDISLSDGSIFPRKSIKRILDDGTISCIPMSDGNTDYQEYLAWVAEGNTPDPAD